MADSNVAITQGSGTLIDTRTPDDGQDHRQVIVVGSPTITGRVQEVDAFGRALVATSGGSTGSSGPTQIESTSANSPLVLNVAQAGNVTFWLTGSGTSTGAAVTAGSVTFEQSVDGNFWTVLPCVRSDLGTAVTTYSGTIASGNALAFDAAVEGVNFVRVRPTANAGSGTLWATIQSGGLPFQPSVTLTGTPAISGTVTANPPSITKGTQGSTGVTTQDLKDAGRSPVAVTAVAAAGLTTEGLLTYTLQRGSGQATGQTASAVTSGKTFRIQSVTASMRLGAAAVGWHRFALRSSMASGTAATATSPILEVFEVGPGSAAVVGAVDRLHVDFPDGIELGSGFGYGITQVGSATTNILTFSLVGFEY